VQDNASGQTDLELRLAALEQLLDTIPEATTLATIVRSSYPFAGMGERPPCGVSTTSLVEQIEVSCATRFRLGFVA
jgi:hypothetical protein